jgi:hypothetical protein
MPISTSDDTTRSPAVVNESQFEQPDHVASSLEGKVVLRWSVDAADWRSRPDG